MLGTGPVGFHGLAFVDQLPNVNATIVPFQLGRRRRILVPWKAGGEHGSHAVHDAEYGTQKRIAYNNHTITVQWRLSGILQYLRKQSSCQRA